jgi:hypothetical protein
VTAALRPFLAMRVLGVVPLGQMGGPTGPHPVRRPEARSLTRGRSEYG